FQKDIMKGRAPRTAICLTSDGTLILAMIEGRNPSMGKSSSIGATLDEFAAMLIQYGAVVAINMDGGGSAAMVIDDKTVSYYPGGARAVTNAIAIFDRMGFGHF
ncbi:MAG: phosphodiester glycosidase family protein, partial [bacterium]